MNLSVGIVGLPNAGKSTLFNSLLGRSIADTAAYPFCTIEPNEGVVVVPDNRLAVLAKIVKTSNIVPAVIKFIDIAGLVKGAAQGEGLGNKFLAHIREVDCICFVLRDFIDDKVVQTGSNPKNDFETVKSELILKDLETVEKVQNSNVKTQNQNLKLKIENLIKNININLNKGLMVNKVKFDDEEKEIVKFWCLLTDKPYFVVLNVSENELLNIKAKINQYKDWTTVLICAKLEEQLAGLSNEEQKDYLKSVGLEKSGMERLIQTAYRHLGLFSFLTAGEKEVRAWTIKKGTKAPQAAGVIHTDFEKNFIKVKVVNYQDFINFGGWQNCKEQGKIRLEGRDYEVEKDDVVEFQVGC